MKILLLTDRMDAGGAETHVLQLALFLKRNGHIPTVLSGGGRLCQSLTENGIPHIRVALPSHNPLRLLAVRRQVHRLIRREGFSVLHAHTRLTAHLIRGASRKNCAEIVTAHAKFRATRFLRFVSYWGNRTIAVSEDLRLHLQNAFALPTERITVIHNAIDQERFFPPAESPPPGILFASRLDEDCSRGAELLLEIAPKLRARFPDLRIGIAGGGNAYPALRKRADALNAQFGEAAVTLYHHVREMPALLREYPIFVGVSRAALEAACCGCAVVLCGNEGYLGFLDAHAIPRAALSNFCARGEARPDTSRLLADLLWLLEHPKDASARAEETAALLRPYTDPKRCGLQTLEVYRRAFPSRRGHRLLIGGYYGCGNLGDDAILQGLLFELHKLAPDLSVSVLSGAPRRDHARLGIPCIARKNPLALFFAIWRSDAFAFGGGSLLQNRSGRLSLAYYLFLLRLARRLGRPTALLCSGIGPLLGEDAKRRCFSVLSRVHHIGVRDGRSLQILQEVIPPERLLQSADAALLLPLPTSERQAALRRELGINEDIRCLGVVLNGNTPPALFASILQALGKICAQRTLHPLFLIFDVREDFTLSRRACDRLKGSLLPPQSPSDALALLCSCEVVLSLRLHGLILATRAGTPALAINADATEEKLLAFAAEAGLPCLASADGRQIEAALTSLLERAPQLRISLGERCAEMRKKAQKDLANMLEIVYNKGK